MNGFLEATYDKFIFRVKTDCLYTKDDFWARVDGTLATVGVADFWQKVSGDVAFLEMVAPGTEVRQDQELGNIETIKAAAGILSPVTGKVVEVNAELETSPFLINQDPYGAGWIYRIEMTDPEGDRAALLDAEAYFALMKEKFAQEAKRLYGKNPLQIVTDDGDSLWLPMPLTLDSVKNVGASLSHARGDSDAVAYVLWQA